MRAATSLDAPGLTWRAETARKCKILNAVNGILRAAWLGQLYCTISAVGKTARLGHRRLRSASCDTHLESRTTAPHAKPPEHEVRRALDAIHKGLTIPGSHRSLRGVRASRVDDLWQHVHRPAGLGRGQLEAATVHRDLSELSAPRRLRVCSAAWSWSYLEPMPPKCGPNGML